MEKVDPKDPVVQAQVQALLAQYELRSTGVDRIDFRIVQWLITTRDPQERAEDFRERYWRWQGRVVKKTHGTVTGKVRYIRPRRQKDIKADIAKGVESPSAFEAYVVWATNGWGDYWPLHRLVSVGNGKENGNGTTHEQDSRTAEPADGDGGMGRVSGGD